LVVIAMASFAGANRVGGEVGRLERAERLSYLLEARAYEQAALDSRATSSGALDEAMARRAAAIRQELTAALAELAALHPDDPAVRRVRAAAVDWRATLDTKLALLAAGDLVAANRVDRAQVDPGFERLAALLRTTAADYSRAASAAQGRSKAGALAVVVAATLLSLVLMWRVERARSRQRAAEEKARKERSRLVNKILSVTERQRSGMAAELHDGPIQGLTRLGLSLERGQLRLRRGQLEEGRQLLSDAQAGLAAEVQSLRRIMATLRPPVLEERGLVSALSDYVEVVRQQSGISCTLAAKLPERLPEDTEIVLYRVAQEALTNVARHARASRARVELTETAEAVVLEVHDDGIGFDPAAQQLGGLDHFGLAGMRERVELAGGTWTVWSRPGSGTVLTASLPKALVAA
ncbi:MAG TPA: sensor histidine kinase, partial [Actinomycetota bacterium]|nr:sensor histidine kinase [Actinomycetota bacterium]